MFEKNDVPAGYWQHASGALVPVEKIKPIDKDRTKVVTELAEAAKKMNAALVAFKLESMHAVEQFIARSHAEYGVTSGGEKGNVTLTSFEGRYKITRQMQDRLEFDERLQAAKALIDQCINDWAKGSNSNIKALVNSAFQVDREGKISVGRVLGLRKIEIKDDARWSQAMKAIADSMQVSSTKAYIRFYELDTRSGDWVPISLDVAGV